MVESINEVFEARDGMSKQGAKVRIDELSSTVNDVITSGASYSDIEDMLLDEGLEMDYLLDLI